MTDIVHLPRNLAHERALTHVAAQSAGSHGGRLISLAEARVLPGPVTNALGRDFVREGCEEGADWRNYMCWGIRQLDETRREDPSARRARAELMASLGAVSVAFDHLINAAVLLGTTSWEIAA